VLIVERKRHDFFIQFDGYGWTNPPLSRDAEKQFIVERKFCNESARMMTRVYETEI
jgi:hypothetical protein